MPRPSFGIVRAPGDIVEQKYAGEKWARGTSRHGEREVVRAAHTRRNGARLEWKAALGSTLNGPVRPGGGGGRHFSPGRRPSLTMKIRDKINSFQTPSMCSVSSISITTHTFTCILMFINFHLR